ncbi:MAG: hypothetical protein Q9210_001131 [Variospora velana]
MISFGIEAATDGRNDLTLLNDPGLTTVYTSEYMRIYSLMTSVPPMATLQYHLGSQASSSNKSYTHLTPSETWPAQSALTLDGSQFDIHTNPEDSNAFGEGVIHGVAPMDVDCDALLNIVPTLDSYPPDMTGSPAVENGQRWAAIDLGRGGSPGPYPKFAIDGDMMAEHYDNCTIAADNSVGSSHIYSYGQNQRMQSHLAALEQAVHCVSGAGQRSYSPTLVMEEPRYVPAVTVAPWSAFMAKQQINDTRPVSELIYDPATDYGASGPIGQRPGHGVDFPSCSRSNDPMDTDDSSDNALFPDDNIDPPPVPDPVGPPLEIMVGDKDYDGQPCVIKPSGGRRQGPLKPQSRENARITRQKGPCWPCILQRNQCEYEDDGDEMCKGCKHKRKQSLIEGCPRFRLPDLTPVFIPSSLAEQHDPEKLRAFARQRVHRWLDNHMPVHLTWGYGRPIKVDVTEIESIGTSLLLQYQYRLNLVTNQFELVKVPSPPLGMVLMPVAEMRRMFSEYLEELLGTSFWEFPEVCFRGDDCRVAKEFLIPIFKYHEAATANDWKMVHESLKLVVLTHIMTHSLTLVEHTKGDVYRRLRNPPQEQFSHLTCPRWLNRQIKFLLSMLHHDVLKTCLSLVQEKLRASTRKPSWAALFASMLVLAMTTETLEQTLRCKEKTEKEEGTIRHEDTTADDAIALMDERFEHLKNFFHQGYRTHMARGFNPLRSSEDRKFLDEPSRSLAAKASDIVKEHYAFLVARQVLPAPSTPSVPQTGRLVAQFLLGFSTPMKQHLHQPAVPASS